MSWSYNWRFLSFIEYWAIDNLDKPIYNVVAKDGPFSYTSNTSAHGMCVGNGTKEQEANKDTFVCPTNLENLFKKQAKKLWQKHKKGLMSVHMWVNENKESLSHCNEYGIWDLISMLDGDMSFTIGIEIEWQIQMMIIHGNKKVV